MPATSTRLSLLFSCLGHTYVHLFTAFYFVIVLALEVDWNLPYHELIELWTLGALLVGIGALPAGWLADRWSAPGMMVIYFIGLGAASMVCAVLDRPAALLVGLAAIGIFSSIYHPVGIAWLVRNAASRGKALGVNGIFGSLGTALAGLVAGGLIDSFGWRAAFMVPGLVCLATGLALLVCLRLRLIADDGQDRIKMAPASQGDMIRVFAILLLTMVTIGIVYQATQVALPKLFDLRLREIAGEGAFGIGTLVAGVYLVAGLAQLVGGHLADRYPLKPVYLSAFVLQVPLLTAVAAFAGLPLIVAAMLAVTLSVAATPAENMLLARYTPSRHRSLAFGLKFVLAFGSAPLALKLVAVIQERTGEFGLLFYLLAGLCVVCSLAVMLLPGERSAEPVASAAAE